MAITATTVRLIARSRNDTTVLIRNIDRDLTAAWALTWDDLAPMIRATLESMVRKESITWPRASDISTSVPLRRMLTDVGRSTTKLVEISSDKITRASRDAVTRAAGSQKEIIASQLPFAWRPQLMEATGGDRLSTSINRASRRITTLTRAIPSRIDKAMRKALVRGVPDTGNPRTTINRMMSSLRTAFGSGLTQTLTISGTEIMDARRAGAALGAETYSDVVTGWIWLARLDRRTCSACMSMHGTEHPLSEAGPDGHGRCRCERTPKTKSWKELGLDIGLKDPLEPADLVLNAKTFFEGLGKADQLRILGPTKLQMLQDGEIEWSDLATYKPNPRWRGSYVPTSVRDLARKTG